MIAMLSVALTFLCALTAQVAAQTSAPGGVFNVSLGKPAKTFLFNQLLDFTIDGPIAQCANNCTTVKTTLQNTAGDPRLLCLNDTVKALRDCEQCMYEGFIKVNKPVSDPRAGSTPVLTGYVAACSERANDLFLTLAKANTTLTLAPNWDGPTGIFVPTIGLVFTVGTGAFLGVSAIILLSNM